MQKQPDKIDRIELDDEEIAAMRLRFPPAPRSGQVVVECKDLTKKYGENTVLDKVEFRLERGERVAFVGQNGQGKSTLAKMIVKEIEKSAGDLNLGYNVSIGYYAQNQSEALPSSLTLLETMESESPAELRPQIRKILAAFLFSGEDVSKKVSVLSGGERARLAMACMLLHPFNLLVLDEPTNHLDMISKEVLKKALEEYDGAMIVVSHDRDFLTGMTDQVLEFRDRKLHHYLGDVNHFLEKRQTTDLREIERSSTAPKPKAAVAPDPVQSEERKKLQRQVAQAEKNIERLEADIATFETQMAVAGFYERPDAQKIMSQYDRVKAELQQAMEAWEESQMALEELG